ncbi:MAG: FecR domain-containing protein [Bacteroidetes bacterium]|nr:FecR domain-containing protein [Bacteroidota bacterium]
MHIPENIQILIEKYQSGKASPEETRMLNSWYRSFNDSQVEFTATENDAEVQLEERIKNRILHTLRDEIKPAGARFRWQMPMVAAAVLLLLSAGLYFLLPYRFQKQQLVSFATQPVNDIAPGGNRAVLTLADGSTVVLDSASNGTISQQGNIQVKKLDNGLLAYTVNGKKITENDETFYNTITTPRGGQYHITLADGTLVWLNAASSIRFPVVFSGTERKVTITGEAYFEVAKNAAMPFKVKAAASEIEVLGTHFNVNAYEDEASIKTTLLEGSVKVSATAIPANRPAVLLKPGQQSGISKAGIISVQNNADIEEAMAWKNGRFQFKSADLNSILRQISRWYDVDVVYNGKADLHFTGQLARNANVSNVFKKLALTGEVSFRIDGKKIIVSP